MTNSNRPGGKNSEKEAVMAHPGIKPVKSGAGVRGGQKRPSDPMTGGGKVKSAAGQTDPSSKTAPVGRGTKKNAVGATSPKSGSRAGTAATTKMGMAKSSKLKEPGIGTATASPGSRAEPKAASANKAGGLRPKKAAAGMKKGSKSKK